MENNQTITLKLNKSYTAIAITLIIVCCIIGAYLIAYAIKPPGYHEMYLLDAQNQAKDYPQTVIINQNNTFTMPLAVTNNMKATQDYQVQMKIVHHTLTFPVDAPIYSAYDFTLDAGQTWNEQLPISINEEGNYSVVFELYTKNYNDYVFTNLFLVRHINVLHA